MAFVIPRNQTIGEALQQAFGLAAPGLIQGAQQRTADQQFQQSLAGLTGARQDTGVQGLQQFNQLAQATGLPQRQIPEGQAQFDQFSGITDPRTQQSILGGLAQQQFVDPFGVEQARVDLLRAQAGQVGTATPISPEESALKKAQAAKLLKETANIDPNTLTIDEKRKRDLIDAGISPKAVSKAESDLIASQISKNRAEANKLLRESNGVLSNEDKTKQSNVFRKEFNALSKDFTKSRDAFLRVEASAVDPSAAGDLALIFNFMKVLDPGSVVRESEFANAAASGAFGERVKAAGLRILNGERLSPVMRADFLNRAKRLFKAQQGNQNKLIKRYRALSTRFGVNPEDVIAETSNIESSTPSRQSLNPADLDNLTLEQLQNL